MYVIEEVKGEVYKKIINYLCNKCDVVMMVIRHEKYNGLLDNQQNEYEEKIKKFRKKIDKYLIYEKHDTKWVGSEIVTDEKNKFDICFYKTNDVVKGILLENNSFGDWMPPFYPEDISFFQNGYCYLQSVSHEGEVLIYYYNHDEYLDLINIGVKFDKEYILPLTERFYEDYLI